MTSCSLNILWWMTNDLNEGNELKGARSSTSLIELNERLRATSNGNIEGIRWSPLAADNSLYARLRYIRWGNIGRVWMYITWQSTRCNCYSLCCSNTLFIPSSILVMSTPFTSTFSTYSCSSTSLTSFNCSLILNLVQHYLIYNHSYSIHLLRIYVYEFSISSYIYFFR